MYYALFPREPYFIGPEVLADWRQKGHSDLTVFHLYLTLPNRGDLLLMYNKGVRVYTGFGSHEVELYPYSYNLVVHATGFYSRRDSYRLHYNHKLYMYPL